jgi:hypothetical protein
MSNDITFILVLIFQSEHVFMENLFAPVCVLEVPIQMCHQKARKKEAEQTKNKDKEIDTTFLIRPSRVNR